MTDDMETESEKAYVSRNKLDLLLENQRESKEKHLKEVSQLKARIIANEKALQMYEDAIQKLRTTHKQKSSKLCDGSKKFLEELQKGKKLDEWYEKNKDKLINEEYEKNYKSEVDTLREKLGKIFES